MARRKRRYERGPEDMAIGVVVTQWPEDKPTPQEVAQRVKYSPSGEHKNYYNKKWASTYRRFKKLKSICDRINPKSCPRILEALQQGIESLCVSQKFDGDFPCRVWAKINGKLHEARLTNKGQGVYHAFPLQPHMQRPFDRDHRLEDVPDVEVALL